MISDSATITQAICTRPYIMAGVGGCGGSRSQKSAATKPIIVATVSDARTTALRVPSNQPAIRTSNG